MDASHILLHCGGLPASRKLPPKAGDFCRRTTNSKTKLSASFVVSVMPQLKSTITGAPETPATTKPAMTVYRDNWFDRLAIHHLIRAFQTTAGSTSNKKGYEGFIEEAIMVSRKYGTKKQQDLAIKTLEKAFPPLILKMAKYFLTPSKFSREFLAKVTAVGFSWLVGRCEVKESQFEGRKEKNTVYIHKCRFLESTSCVATCRNICKIPTQKFIHDSLGMPVNMVPKFEDMSCEMIFGQHPPEDDPALKHPCYQTCKAKQTHGS